MPERLPFRPLVGAGGLLAVLVLCGPGWHCSIPAPARSMPLDVQTHPWYQRTHHHAGGFRNVWGEAGQGSFLKAAQWMLGSAFRRKANTPPVVRPVDPEALRRRPARLRVTWMGHSNAYVQTPALDLLLDPMFGERASPLSFAGPRRAIPPPLRPEELPEVDVVLVSHNHYDHLDEGSIRRLQERFAPLFLVPLGVGATLRDWGAGRVVELDWWQYVDVDGIRYHCTPARHFSGRSLTDRDETLWAGWYVEQPGSDSLRLFYAGDTGYAPHFTEVRERLGVPEVALLPIGAYLPRWFMAPVHVDPEEAVRAFADLQARHFVPVHWGVFDLADETLQEPPARLRTLARAHGLADRIHLLDVGGSFTLDGAPGGDGSPTYR